MHIDDLVHSGFEFKEQFAEYKAQHVQKEFEWYRYSTLTCWEHLTQLLKGDYRLLSNFVTGSRIADIGAADGDLSFYLEKLGGEVDLIDNPATNHNALKAARFLKQELDSKVRIHTADLDDHFSLPREKYDLAFFLGILYHLKNPFYALENLSKVSAYCFLSTRICRFTANQRTAIRDEPVAYLVSPTELNDDETNYWIFSETGLRRIVARAGWTVCCWGTYGNRTDSDPVRPEGDERAYCLLRSNIAFDPLPDAYPPHIGRSRWTKRSARGTIISAEQGRVAVRGYVPQDVFAEAYRGELEMTLACGDRKQRVRVDPQGKFEAHVEVPPYRKLELSVSFNKSFTPLRTKLGDDHRELAAIIDKVEIL